jgi:hypothetical protein
MYVTVMNDTVKIGNQSHGEGLINYWSGYDEVRWYWYGTCQEGRHRQEVLAGG